MKHVRGKFIALCLAVVAWVLIPVSSAISPVLTQSKLAVFAALSLLLSLIVLIYFLVEILRLFRPRQYAHRRGTGWLWSLQRHFDSSVYSPGRPFRAYEDILRILPENEIDFLKQAREQVKHGDLVPGTKNYSAFIREMRNTEFRHIIRSYRLAMSRLYLASLFFSGSSLILAFSALYLVIHVFTGGSAFIICPGIPSTGSGLEALYFSVATAATVGFGDIHASTSSPWAQLIATAEIGVFLFFVAYSVNYGMSTLNSVELSPLELTEALRTDLEDAYHASMILTRKGPVGGNA